MRWFWQKKEPAPKREVPDTALRTYPYLWRISDHKLYTRNSNGLYMSEDGEFIHLYLLQRIRWGQTHDYILSHNNVYPFGEQFFPHEPLAGQDSLLKKLDRSEARHLSAAK